MTVLLSTLLVLAVDEPGEGGDPGRLGGILLVIGAIVLAVLVVAVLVRLVIARSRRTTAGDETRQGEHDRGRVGRIWGD